MVVSFKKIKKLKNHHVHICENVTMIAYCVLLDLDYLGKLNLFLHFASVYISPCTSDYNFF